MGETSIKAIMAHIINIVLPKIETTGNYVFPNGRT